MTPRPFLGSGQRFPAYRTLGTVGAAVGTVVVLLLGLLADRPLAELAIVLCTAPLAFLLAVKISVVVFGHERIVFYEQTLFVLGCTALLLYATGRPLGAGLDLSAVGVGIFLVFGRLGCYRVACCYGRPARWGVRYGDEHARLGFPRWLVGRTLLPLQLVDAAVSAAAVAAAIIAWSLARPPGHAAAIYLVIYGLGRFVEELFRFDAARPRWGGASEAQWTAALIAWGLVLVAGPRWWTLANAAVLSAGFAAVVTRPRRLTDAWHTAELADKLRSLEARERQRAVTSMGIHASFARIDTAAGVVRDFLLSAPDAAAPLDAATVTRLAAAVGLDDATVRPAATPGLFHVLINEARRTPGT